ncbi:MAG: hypothetical protein ACRDP1_08455 [Nocardioidaceae bacterium]
MPITPLTLQRRLAEVGRIRIGETVPTASGKLRPAKLDRFRFTTPDKPQLDRVAAAYGGTVKPWTPANGGAPQWEVVTDVASVPVIVPPQALTQWMELWTGGGCARRCDGETEILSDAPCLCAAADQLDCKPTTRLSVLLRDIEGLGSWRLESKGWNAAAELPGMAELLAKAGGWIAARLYLKPVRQVTDGKTRDFMVPALAVDGLTPAQLLAGGTLAHTGQVDAGADRAALGPGTPTAEPVDYVAAGQAAGTAEELRVVWAQAQAADPTGWATSPIRARLLEIADTITPGTPTTTPAPDTPAPDTPTADKDDPDLIWYRILAAAGHLDMDTSTVEQDFAAVNGGTLPDSASAAELATYLDRLHARTGQVVTP